MDVQPYRLYYTTAYNQSTYRIASQLTYLLIIHNPVPNPNVNFQPHHREKTKSRECCSMRARPTAPLSPERTQRCTVASVVLVCLLDRCSAAMGDTHRDHACFVAASKRFCLPTGTHIVFLGDSTLRYQYLMLAYAIRHGREWQPLAPGSGTASSMHSRLGSVVDHNWTAFYLETTAMLRPYEHCDCYRNALDILENRYFTHAPSNVRITYLQAFKRGERCQGTWWPGDPNTWRTPHTVFAPRWTLSMAQLVRKLLPLLRAKMVAANTAVVLNLGHWLARNTTHPRLLQEEFDELGAAANDSLPQGAQLYWSTTSACPLHPYSRRKHTWCASTWGSTRHEARAARAAGFRIFDAFNITQSLHEDDYIDGLHLMLPNVCALNGELLNEFESRGVHAPSDAPSHALYVNSEHYE